MGLTESSWNWPKYVNGNMMVDQNFNKGNMRVHGEGVRGVLFFNIVPLTVVLVYWSQNGIMSIPDT